MNKVLFILAVCISIVAIGQQKPKVVAKFEDTARIGNVFTRWYYDLAGTSLVWKKDLTLYSDSTYRYVYQGGECGSFDEDVTGVWRRSGNFLILQADNYPDRTFQLVEGKLYWPETRNYDKQNVVMK